MGVAGLWLGGDDDGVLVGDLLTGLKRRSRSDGLQFGLCDGAGELE